VKILLVKQLRIKNFKLIDEAELAFSRVNVLIGPNGSGKSSVLHALNAVRALMPDANGHPKLFLGDAWHSYGDIVYMHDYSRFIVLYVKGALELAKGVKMGYELELKVDSEKGGRSRLKLDVNEEDAWSFENDALSHPVGSGSKRGYEVGGCFVTLEGRYDNPMVSLYRGRRERATLLLREDFSNLLERYVGWCPAFRGKVEHVIPSSPPEPLKVVAGRPELKEELNKLLTEILNFKSKVDIASTVEGGLSLLNVAFRVNVALEAFSMSQLLYMLPLGLALPRGGLLLVEEPEIHLHPAAQARLTESLIKVARERNLQLILTTHSEHILFRVLTLVREGVLPHSELKIHYFERGRDPPKALIEEIKVNERGEMDKGLRGFFEAELDEFERFIRAKARG